MEACFGSFYFAFFLYIVLRSILFFTALKYSGGNIKIVIFLTLMVDFIALMFIPILFMMTGGVCNG